MLQMFHVKHCSRSIVEAIADDLGLQVPSARLQACSQLADWLAPAAAKLGLTQYDTGPAVMAKLMAPGLYLVRHMGDTLGRIAEIGPGSGALGLGLSMLLPAADVTLLDRRRRVCAFLDLAIKRFELSNCHTLCVDMRGPTDGSHYDLVVARAVASSAELFTVLPQFLAADGAIALFQAARPPEFPPELSQVAHIATNLPELWLDIYARPGGVSAAR